MLSEDEQAWSLASSEHFCLDWASQFLLGTSWLQSPSGRSRVGVLDQGGFARVLGFYQRGGVTGVTREWARFPGFAKLLARMVTAVDPKHEFTTLTILRQNCAKPHMDKYNLPVSNLILPLRVPPSGGGGRWGTMLDGLLPRCGWQGRCNLLPFQPCYLDPCKWHATEGWEEGSRVLLVAYSLKGISRATAEQRRSLRCTITIRQSLDNSCSRRAVCVREVEELRWLRIDQSMRDHVLAGHIPYRRDWYACVAGRIHRPSHFRSQVSESFTLSLDLACPFKEGDE